MKLAVADVVYSAPALVAEAKGYFAQEGLALEIQHFKLGRICLEKMLAGEVDFATASDVSVLLALMNRNEFDILATIAMSDGDNQMVFAKGRGIVVPADLRGKRIGVLKGTSAHYFVDSFLLFHGINPSEVTHVPMDIKSVGQEMERGEVDAAGFLSSQMPEVLRRMKGKVTVAEAVPVYTGTFNLLGQSASGRASDADAKKILQALRRAEQFIKAEPVQSQMIVARALSVPVDAVAQSWRSFDFRLNLSQKLVSSLESQERWARINGMVPQDTPTTNLLDRIRVDPLKNIDPRAMRLMK